MQHQIKYPTQWIQQTQGFAAKPANGSGGKGILIIQHHDGKYFHKPSGEILQLHDVQRHLSNILSGLFSLSTNSDTVIIEELIQLDDVFTNYTYEGIPDIRIIVFQGFPIMAMLRLSTHASDGKANLHQGALGVGINIATGAFCDAICNNERIEKHPDTNAYLHAITIHNWEKLLRMASNCYRMTQLGYLGVDIVLDKNRGPLILELNARPGLSIQLANNSGLLARLQQIEEFLQHNTEELSVEKRVQIAQEFFA
jgi:alpha-L-glutamate ligase-like protein